MKLQVPSATQLLPRAIAAAALISLIIISSALAEEKAGTDSAMDQRVQALIPDLEAYIAKGMKDFDLPGLAIGIVSGDKLVYGKGFGVRSRGNGEPVDTKTVFQIGSTTKAFLATSLAIAVDQGKLHWDDRIVDLEPEFQMKDAWVTREFRVFDLLAQRSGMPPYANDMLGIFGLDETALIRSLRDVEPVSSFRSTFAYTNITHLLAGRVVAKAMGAPNGDLVIHQELLEPLGMNDTSYTAEAIMAAPNHAEGHRWTPDGVVEVSFTQIFPYDFGGAGDINSTIEDLMHWVRLQLGNGTFEGERLVSPEALAFTHTPKVAVTDKLQYAYGWVVQQTPNGNIIWHNGGTLSFGAFIGIVPDKDLGVIVLSNETNVGLPDAIGLWTFDRLLGNPEVDIVAEKLKQARAGAESTAKTFAKPDKPRPFPPLGPLAGSFSHPTIGKLVVSESADHLIAELAASGAKLGLVPWDGDVFTATLMPTGRFGAVADDLGPDPNGFVQFLIDKDGKLNVLRLSVDGQSYDFTRD